MSRDAGSKTQSHIEGVQTWTTSAPPSAASNASSPAPNNSWRNWPKSAWRTPLAAAAVFSSRCSAASGSNTSALTRPAPGYKRFSAPKTASFTWPSCLRTSRPPSASAAAGNSMIGENWLPQLPNATCVARLLSESQGVSPPWSSAAASSRFVGRRFTFESLRAPDAPFQTCGAFLG